MKAIWRAAPLLVLSLALAGAAQASSYIAVNGSVSVAEPGQLGRALGVSYDSRIGETITDTLPGGSSVAVFGPASAPTGLTSAGINGGLSGGLYDGHASFATAADLRNGTLHASAASGASYAPYNGYSSTNATMVDTLHFTVASGGSASVVFTAHVDGAIAMAPSIYAEAGWTDQVGFGGPGGPTFIYFGGTSFDAGLQAVDYGTYLDAGHVDTRVGWDSVLSSNLSNTGHDFRGVFTVSDGQSLDFTHRFALQCVGGACDFGNTAAVGLILSDGVSFTSDSGVFLTQAGGVPEPQVWALMLVGCGLAGAALRRRGRAIAVRSIPPGLQA